MLLFDGTGGEAARACCCSEGDFKSVMVRSVSSSRQMATSDVDPAVMNNGQQTLYTLARKSDDVFTFACRSHVNSIMLKLMLRDGQFELENWPLSTSAAYARPTCRHTLCFAVYIYSTSYVQRRENGSDHGRIADAVDSQTTMAVHLDHQHPFLPRLRETRELTQMHSNSSTGNNVVTIFPTSRPPSVHQPHSPFSCRLL